MDSDNADDIFVLEKSETIESLAGPDDEEVSSKSFFSSLNPNQKEEHLFKVLRENTVGSDVMLCMFIAALNSYKADQCLRPFPSLFINNYNKDFSELRTLCDTLPSIQDIVLQNIKLSSTAVNFLTWLLIETGRPRLNKIKVDDVSLPGNINSSLIPHAIFKVQYDKRMNEKWERRKRRKDTFLAYHGSKIENFYSIVKVGLQQNVDSNSHRVPLFGNGIYLASEIAVSAIHAPFGLGWKNSILGGKMSIIALCEVINDVDKVKCKDVNNRRRSFVQGCFSEIPDKYFVVTDSDMIQIKYLLVYKASSLSAFKSCLCDNVWLVMLGLYVLFLLGLSFFNSATYRRFIHGFQFFR